MFQERNCIDALKSSHMIMYCVLVCKCVSCSVFHLLVCIMLCCDVLLGCVSCSVFHLLVVLCCVGLCRCCLEMATVLCFLCWFVISAYEGRALHMHNFCFVLVLPQSIFNMNLSKSSKCAVSQDLVLLCCFMCVLLPKLFRQEQDLCIVQL